MKDLEPINELLLALSNMMDEKFKPIDECTKRIEVMLENDIMPLLHDLESCTKRTKILEGKFNHDDESVDYSINLY